MDHPPDVKSCLCRVLSPYLRGGGAKSLDFQSLSQDLIRTSMQIPFSVPPYMSLLARSTATLEGIALMGYPNYQMVSQVNAPLNCSNICLAPDQTRDSAYRRTSQSKQVCYTTTHNPLPPLAACSTPYIIGRQDHIAYVYSTVSADAFTLATASV